MTFCIVSNFWKIQLPLSETAQLWVSPRFEETESVCWIYGYQNKDQANTILRNSWITELEEEELEKKVTGNDVS